MGEAVLPLILVALEGSPSASDAADEALHDVLASALRHRFGADYDVSALRPDEALDRIDEASADGRLVAAVIAGSLDENGAEAGVRLLTEVRARSAGSRRLLLVPRGGWRTHPVREAMVLGYVDGYLFVPWAQVEQWLYLPMSEYLAAWERSLAPTRTAFTIVGREHHARVHALGDILSRIEVPYTVVDSTGAAGQELLARWGLDGAVLPVLGAYSGQVLVDPSDQDLVELLGFHRTPPRSTYDVAIVGAGPSGLSAAVYAASEGLTTVVVDPSVPGGQAGTSSMIRNYLGFPRGVSGAELTNRAFEQAWLFGTDFLLAESVTGIELADDIKRLLLAGGGAIESRAVVVAAGVTWRRLRVPSLDAFLGAGVFYGAAASEAAALHGADVVVVGGGNSAGQAAIHLAKSAARVTIMVRRDGLAATMSDYLIQEIASTANVDVRTESWIVDGGGAGRLEWLTVETPSGREKVRAAALFVMIGAEPRTDWLPDAVARDPAGFLLTGADAAAAGWSAARPPMFLETSAPGVFAVGDVVHGSTKRVAPSVGSGAVAIELVHRYLSLVAESGGSGASERRVAASP